MKQQISKIFLLTSMLISTACGDEGPDLIAVKPCVGSCVAEVEPATDNLLLIAGDTARLYAEARTADHEQVPVRWTAGNNLATVSEDGRVVALTSGHSWANVESRSGERRGTNSNIWIVDPDSSTQPFITLYRNAANGDTLFRRRGFFDVDSIDITISYVAGRLSVLPSGTPSLVFDIRNSGTSNVLATKLIAITQRGKVVQADVRLRLTEMNANGARRFPAGRYDLFVVMPLADGRVLGAQTGYPIQF